MHTQTLVTLDISHNAIASLEPLLSLTRLRHLIATHNCVSSLAGVATCISLNKLDASNNSMATLQALAGAASCPLLGMLNVSNNPVCHVMEYRLHLVHLLPQVTSLDNVLVDEREKVHAQNLHGADAAVLKVTRERFFPHGELDDGGGAVPPMAAGLLPSDGRESILDSDGPTDCGRIDGFVDSMPPTIIANGLLTFADFLRVRLGPLPCMPHLALGQPPPQHLMGGRVQDVLTHGYLLRHSCSELLP
jgi:hypothetical protein